MKIIFDFELILYTLVCVTYEKIALVVQHTCDIFFLHGRGISSLKSYYLLSYREVYFFVVMTNITSSNSTEADQAYSLFL